MKTYIFNAISAFLILVAVPSMVFAGWGNWSAWGGSTAPYACEQERYYEGTKATTTVGTTPNQRVRVAFKIISAWGQGQAWGFCEDNNTGRITYPAGLKADLTGWAGNCSLQTDGSMLCTRDSPNKCSDFTPFSIVCQNRLYLLE